MDQELVYKMTAVDFELAIERKLRGIMTDNALAPLEGRKITSKSACDILDISQRTLYRMIGAGQIQPLERDGAADYAFDLKEVIQLIGTKYRRNHDQVKAAGDSKLSRI